MRFKSNTIVIFNNYAKAVFSKVEKVFKETVRIEPELTSGMDGTHGPNSLHYRGLAWDFGVKDIPNEKRGIVYDALYKALDPMYYDLLWEGRDTPNEHIHCEFDPKQRRGL